MLEKVGKREGETKGGSALRDQAHEARDDASPDRGTREEQPKKDRVTVRRHTGREQRALEKVYSEDVKLIMNKEKEENEGNRGEE